MDRVSTVLFELLRSSLGRISQPSSLTSLTERDWNKLVTLSSEHGVAALAIDGYNSIGAETILDTDDLEDIRYKWFATIFHVEEDNKYKLRKASRFAAELQHKGVVCYVLKGMAFATYYECPEHRMCGDCDVYLGDGFSIGNEVAKAIKGRYKFGTYKHSHLFFGKLMVENHRYLTDFNGSRQGRKIELLLERTIAAEPGRKIADSELVCPNDHFNALFLLKHAHGNFMYEGMILRMIYDWAALLNCCQDKLDWKLINADLAECRLLGFAQLMTSLCVTYLGIELTQPEISLCQDPLLVEEVMMDTLEGGLHTRGNETFLEKSIRIARRFRRLWHYRRLATESVPRMIWNNFAFSSYLKRKIEM